VTYTSVQLTLPAGYGNSLMRKIAEGEDAWRCDLLLRCLSVAQLGRFVTYGPIVQPEIIRQEGLKTDDSSSILELKKQQR